MIACLPRRPVPFWLTGEAKEIRCNAADILADSVYYPACGFDGRPVQYLAGYCHSFIYVDWFIAESDVMQALSADGAFRGYELVNVQHLSMEELVGVHRWSPEPVDRNLDGDPDYHSGNRKPYFAIWAIFDRMPGISDAYGPFRLSLLFICGDGVRTFESLYNSNGVRPAVVAIVQPGDAFGGNWTSYGDERKIFCRVVLQNPNGIPGHLLVGGRVGRARHIGGPYMQPCWNAYGDLETAIDGDGWRICLWKPGPQHDLE
jgi:hypothetical protein